MFLLTVWYCLVLLLSAVSPKMTCTEIGTSRSASSARLLSTTTQSIQLRYILLKDMTLKKGQFIVASYLSLNSCAQRTYQHSERRVGITCTKYAGHHYAHLQMSNFVSCFRLSHCFIEV